MGKLLHRLAPLIGIGFFCAAVWVLRRELAGLRAAEIAAAIAALPAWRFALAMLLVAGSYVGLSLYDVLALRYIGHPMPYRRTGAAGFMGFALGMNIGFSSLSGGAVRYRLYAAWGLRGGQIARIIGFTTLTSMIGITGLAGLALSAAPGELSPIVHVPAPALRAAGAALLAAIAVYLLWTLRWRRPIRWGEQTVEPPPPRIAVSHLCVSVMEWGLAALAMYSLFPEGQAPPLAFFFGAFVLAGTASLISSVPGGLGVFETVLLLMFQPYADEARIVGALLTYRALFYLVPFALAATALGAFELRQRGRRRAVTLAEASVS